MNSFTIALLASVLAVILGQYVADAECMTNVNGCSVPFRGKFPYSRYFKPACNRHDVCYRCGSHYGWSRFDCDKGFLNDMLDICSKESAAQALSSASLQEALGFLDTCRVAAQSYYSGVRLLGGLFYRRNSPSWCSENPCVKNEGLPNLTVN
eukprot:gene17501-9120_t